MPTAPLPPPPVGMEWVANPSSGDGGSQYVLDWKPGARTSAGEPTDQMESIMRPENSLAPKPIEVRESAAKPEDRSNGP